MEYRPYQIEAINKALSFISDKKNNKRVFIVAPTGSGKSFCIAGIADKIDNPIIILQPSKELLLQNYEKYTLLGNKASIYSASLNTKEIGHVTFATIGSIKDKAHIFKELGVNLVLVDECHIACGGNNMISNFLKQLGNVKVIGLTATPVVLMNTMDQGPILKMLNRTRKSFYNYPLHITQIKEIIELGFWSELIYERMDLDESKLTYNVSHSEFTEESMEKVYDENEVEQNIIKRIPELIKQRKSILIFVPSVAKARNLCTKIKGSRAVWGNMPNKEREEVIRDFKSGLIQIVINVNVLAIGFDFEELECVIDTTPTASIARYYQKLGRACRPHPNKKNALLIDYSGNFNRFGELKDITFEEDDKWGWNMFNKDRMLTGVSLDNSEPIFKTGVENNQIKFDFGKFKGKAISEVPNWYLNWMLKEFEWKKSNMHIKDEILRLKK